MRQRRQPAARTAVLVQQHHVDPVPHGPVQERRGHPHPADAHDLADALEVQPEQRLALMLHDHPLAAAADQAARPVHVDHGLQRMRQGHRARAGQRGHRRPEERHAGVERDDLAFDRVEGQPGARRVRRRRPTAPVRPPRGRATGIAMSSEYRITR